MLTSLLLRSCSQLQKISLGSKVSSKLTISGCGCGSRCSHNNLTRVPHLLNTMTPPKKICILGSGNWWVVPDHSWILVCCVDILCNVNRVAGRSRLISWQYYVSGEDLSFLHMLFGVLSLGELDRFNTSLYCFKSSCKVVNEVNIVMSLVKANLLFNEVMCFLILA